MRLLPLPLAFLLLLSACGSSEPPRLPGTTPQASFEALRTVTLAQDWEAQYLLHAPSEREEISRRWEAARADTTQPELLERLATEAGVPVGALADLSYEEFFVLRGRQRSRPGAAPKGPDDPLRKAKVAEVQPIEDDRVQVMVLIGDAPMPIVFKKERGLWYVHGVLSAMDGF